MKQASATITKFKEASLPGAAADPRNFTCCFPCSQPCQAPIWLLQQDPGRGYMSVDVYS